MSIDKELHELIDGAKYDITINGKGKKAEIKGTTNPMGEIMAIAILASTFAEQRKIKPESFMNLVLEFLETGKMISADTKEELDVMQEIIKNGGKIDG